MSSRNLPAHHRSTAPAGRSGSTSAGRRSGVGRQAAVLAAASGLVLSGGGAAQAAEAPAERDSAPASSLDAKAQVGAPLSADSHVKISFERPDVSTTPAPVEVPVEQPAPVEAAAPAEAAPAPVAPAPAAPAVSVQVQAATPAPAPAPAAGGTNAAMVSAAYAQLGITQDCTAMVEKALGSAGIPVGDLGPMQFMNYGSVVGEPQPGDMVVQSGHVGIYIGDGQVISGGMNGVNATVTHPLSWLTATGGVTFVRAGA
ncbi:NlpC/P60 family protein [Arthrobacter oryzae]|jgi:cell wall-associated NlpC family hydrolase|uniref:NlpC/P60 family protein n=1 Tax=Arthrobacter oryzae TaxID=409290 RepID=UPI0030C90034